MVRRRRQAGALTATAAPSSPTRRFRNILDPTKTETRNREGQDLDRGWNNIGVRPTPEDLGVGDLDHFGNPLSVTRLRPKSDQFIAVDGVLPNFLESP
jgi:hypothetical protein